MTESADMVELTDTAPRRDPTQALPAILIGALSALLVAYLSFSAGGFFPGTTALAAIALIAILVVFIMTARRPGAAIGIRLIAGVVLLALFALWQLVSSSWSHAPGRALLAFDLTLLYVLVLAASGLLVDRPERVRALVYGVLAGMFAACLAGLLSRTLPHVFPVAPGPSDDERLNFPLTYWNAVGIMAACATILCLGLTGSRRERPLVRILTAAAVPSLAATLLFTFSRGSIAVGIGGIVLMIALAPRRELLAGFAAAIPGTAIALVAAYKADALAHAHPTGAAAVSQGRNVIIVVAVCTLATAILRTLLVRVWDERLERATPLSHRVTLGIAGAIVAAVLVAGLAAGGPHRLDRAYHRFVHGSSIQTTDSRDRLTDPGNNGRLKHWRVALDAYRTSPFHGAGAGTYQDWWNRKRPDAFDVLNAHSLYMETLGESGIAGLVVLVLALLAALGGALARVRGPDRALWATMAAAMTAWALEAGVDWIWQMPAASAWFFAFGGAALASSRAAEAPAADGAPRGMLGQSVRLVAGLAVLLVAITPVRVALSQRDLDTAVAALRDGDCRATVDGALSSARMISARAEPYELLAYCDARLGFGPLALQMVERAIARDPDNWEYRYDEALVLGTQGRDPRPALDRAQRLNPLNGEVFRLRRTVGTTPRTWKRRTLNARLLLPVR